MDNESQRVKQTKNDLKEAFWSIYQTQKIEKITIKQVTDKAGFNRGTFYVYYTDIYDLFEQIKNELLEEIDEKGDELINFLIDIENAQEHEKSVRFFLEFYSGRMVYFKKLLGINGEPQFVHQMKQTLKFKYKKYLNISTTTSDSEIEFILEYIISAHIGVITYWFEHSEGGSPKPVIDLMRRIMLGGPLQTLQKMI